MDIYVVSTLQRRQALNMTVNMLPSDPTHDHVTGLINARITGSFDGYKFSHAASGLLWIASGQVTKVSPKTPQEGLLQLDLTIRLSGGMWINGVLVN
jgi:hypothetical protein